MVARVLIYGGAGMFAHMLCVALRSSGFQAHLLPAANPERVLAEAAAFPSKTPVLVITSTEWHRADGDEVALGAQLVPGLVGQRKPVLLLRAGNDPDEEAEIAAGLAAGALTALDASTSLDELRAILSTATGRSNRG
jgi:hypothetical protein